VSWLRQHAVLVTTAGLLLISLTLLMVNTRGQRRVDPLGVIFLETVTPVASLSGAMTRRLGQAWSSYVDLVGVREEREWLRDRVRTLEREVDASQQVRRENERLTALLDLREELGGMPVAARVTGIGASPLFHTATLDRGTSQGITEGMAVLARAGVVGRVVAASPNASRVLLLEDPASGVDAIVQRSRARGILEGGSGGRFHLKYIKPDEELRIGDTVVTSGFDQIFPRGIALGEIVALRSAPDGLFQTAEVLPAVDFGKLAEVLVLDAPKRDDVPVTGED
jgi:rod shape-determining protein MreC